MTIAANVAVPLVVSGTKPRDARKRARELLGKFGLGPLADDYPSTLSGGELQRASIARALVMKPSIVFCDEPTGALDTENSELVVGELRRVAAEFGVGVLIVTHDPSVWAMCDRVLRLDERKANRGGCVMMLFFRFISPRSWRSLSVWIPLIAVGLITCVGLSLAMGFRSGLLAQHETVTLRDGGYGYPPMTRTVGDPPLHSSRSVATGYGPLVLTVFWGEEGQRLGVPGIPRIETSGTVLASPAVLAQLEDDWTGEIEGWMGERSVGKLPDAALAYPRELVIVEFTDTVPLEAAMNAHFQPIPVKESHTPDTSIVVLGLLVLVLPSIALARAGAAVHLNARSRRYGLLRVLGAPPRKLALLIALDIAAPLLAGALFGSVVYAAAMSSLHTFTLAGNSYWASDLVLPLWMALVLPLVVITVGLLSAIRMIARTGRDPVATLRKERKPTSYLAYVSSVGIVAGPAAMFWAANVDFMLSVWLITVGILLSVVGLEGLSRTAVAAAGRLLADWTRAQVAGSRMYRGGAEAVLGVSATAVAVLLIVFSVYANVDNRLPTTGNFDVLVRLPTLMSPDSVVRAMEDVDGVTRVVQVERPHVEIDGNETVVFTMTCDDIRGSVELDAPCVVGNVYLASRLARRTDADSLTLSYGIEFPGAPEKDPSIPGTYSVGGQVTAPWFDSEADDVVLIVDEQPVTNYTILLITTDGAPGSLRRVIEGLRDRPEESYPTTRAALTSGVTDDQLVFFPYLFVMAVTAAGMAAVALLYAVMLLFRQRQAEFRALRSFGATRMLLAVDLALLFAVPLVLAFGLAVASGIILAASYNAAFGVPAPPGNPQAIAALALVLAIGIVATALVAGRATRIPPLVSDPDAATS